LAVLAALLAGCGQNDRPEGIQYTRDAAAPDVVSKATEPSPSPLPTSESTEDEAIDSTLSGVETPSPSPTAVPCQESFFFEPSPSSCPDGPSRVSAAAEQPFERGFMIWLDDFDAVFVFNWDGSWRRFEDTFEEGQLEFDPDVVPPTGMYQPVRGFGKLWREHPEVQERLGWALSRELGFDSTYQKQMTESLDPPVIFILAFNGQVLALTSRGDDYGDWVLAAS
jgi:hypothetical protein